MAVSTATTATQPAMVPAEASPMPAEHQLAFNASMLRENTLNRWKFLEDLGPGGAGGAGAGFLLSSPWPVLSCTCAYILFVCLIGPLVMSRREPFQLKNPIRFYNLVMVLLAGVLVVRLLDGIGSFGALFDCSRAFLVTDGSSSKIYQMGNFILTVRLSEYLDTIFFTLRKKQNQVTFLHVFHHAFVPIYAYWVLRTAPMRFNVFIIVVNSFIHVLMYFYYFIATFQERRQPTEANGVKGPAPKVGLFMFIVNKLLLFKKYMTQLQILQFVSLAVYAAWASFQPQRCGVPKTYLASNLMLALGFLGLFLHFYIRAYRSSAATRSKKRN